jgi:hypothetical protein
VKFLIYALIDPRTGDVRYVGKSSSGWRRARAKHRNGACRVWTDELVAADLMPDIEVLEVLYEPEAQGSKCWWWSGRNASALNDAERYWIHFWRVYGRAPLLNRTEGGEGIRNPTPDVRAARSASAKRWHDVRRARIVARAADGDRAAIEYLVAHGGLPLQELARGRRSPTKRIQRETRGNKRARK